MAEEEGDGEHHMKGCNSGGHVRSRKRLELVIFFLDFDARDGACGSRCRAERSRARRELRIGASMNVRGQILTNWRKKPRVILDYLPISFESIAGARSCIISMGLTLMGYGRVACGLGRMFWVVWGLFGQ